MKRAKITAVKRGTTLRDLVAEGLRQVLNDKSSDRQLRMIKPPVELLRG